MWELIKSNVIAPACTRAGTLVAGALVPLGVNADHAAQIGIGVTAAGLVMTDLFLAYMRKKRIERAAISRAVGWSSRPDLDGGR